MRLLLDTNILLVLIDERIDTLDVDLIEAVLAPKASLYGSVASLWEIAIKARLGKLALKTPLERTPELLEAMGLNLLVIDRHHVLTAAEPEPATRDPFDRLLLSQCLVEGLRLVTLDRVLSAHPLAWQPV
jgi:PIN domain nuclease of toxin-antitoxin system